MADCKVCGGWFSSTAPSELCPTCERALKRLNGYAVPVVRCKDCRWFDKTGYEEDNAHEEDLSLHMGWCANWRRGTQGLRGAKERSVIPPKLCRHIVQICEEGYTGGKSDESE